MSALFAESVVCTGVGTGVGTALHAGVETALDAMLDASLEASIEAPVETPVQSSAEAPFEAPVETVVEAGVEAGVEAPVETDVESVVETALEASIETCAAQAPGQPQPLYARADFRRVAGEALRPGGLELTRRALELAALPQNALVADLGCGPGATAQLLAQSGHRVLALDLSEASLAAAQGPGVSVLCASAQRLPLASGSLAAVFCECVLSAMGMADHGTANTVLAEAARVLAPGGVLVLSDLYLREMPGAPGLYASGPCASGPSAGNGAGGCLAGARGRAELLAGLAACGLSPFVFEDHSRLLAELAGRLIFAGLDPAVLGLGCAPSRHADSAHGPTSGPTSGSTSGATLNATPRPARGACPGYFLCLARKSAPGAS